jgi:hypothetical protein
VPYGYYDDDVDRGVGRPAVRKSTRRCDHCTATASAGGNLCGRHHALGAATEHLSATLPPEVPPGAQRHRPVTPGLLRQNPASEWAEYGRRAERYRAEGRTPPRPRWPAERAAGHASPDAQRGGAGEEESPSAMARRMLEQRKSQAAEMAAWQGIFSDRRRKKR